MVELRASTKVVRLLARSRRAFCAFIFVSCTRVASLLPLRQTPAAARLHNGAAVLSILAAAARARLLRQFAATDTARSFRAAAACRAAGVSHASPGARLDPGAPLGGGCFVLYGGAGAIVPLCALGCWTRRAGPLTRAHVLQCQAQNPASVGATAAAPPTSAVSGDAAASTFGAGADAAEAPQWRRKTKVICTIGPAVVDRERLFALADAGMNVARCARHSCGRRPPWPFGYSSSRFVQAVAPLSLARARTSSTHGRSRAARTRRYAPRLPHS